MTRYSSAGLASTASPTGSLRRKAYNYIHSRILSGDLPDGYQLSELSLAREIGISRTPVREAIQQLQREGLIKQLPRLGSIVQTPGRRDILELYELREALEPFAVGLAAQRAPEVHFRTLERLCAEMDRIGEELRRSGMTTLDPSRHERFLTADMAFHVLLLRASGNYRIMKIVADSRVLIRIFSTQRGRHNIAVLRETYRFHSQILDAVQNRDSQAATAAMAEHIRVSKRETLEHYDRVQAEAGEHTPVGLPEHLLQELDRIMRELEVEK